MDVVGNAMQTAEIEFNGALTNQGAVRISVGTSNVYGNINNQSGATIAVKENGIVIFWDDLTNKGTVDISRAQ